MSIFAPAFMKRIFLALAVLSCVTWTSCVKETAVQPLTKKEIKKQVDSIVSSRARQVEQNAQRDLQLRMKIEVKAKADSLANIQLHPADTAHTPKH